MKILAFDTAAEGCAAALLKDDHVLGEVVETMARGQDAHLVPMLEALLAGQGMTFDKLDRIAVTTGPGSFTGLRVGLATAHGLQLATGIPIIGVDCFTLSTAAIHTPEIPHTSMLVILESKREELYARHGAAEAFMATAPALAEYARTHRTKLAGDAAYRVIAIAPDLATQFYPPTCPNRAVTAARIAMQQSPTPEYEFPKPFYLRTPDVTKPKSKH